MPAATITIDDVSPLIDYQPAGAWRPGNDSMTNDYSSGTFTLSTVIGASATISFNATGITLVGSMWDNHGNYNITLDGTVFPKNGYSQARVFNASLFTISNLDNKLHTISFTNAGTDPNTSLDYVDLDYVTWKTTYGIESQPADDITIQSSDSSFLYQPQATWSTDQYAGSTGYQTYTFGASATLTFMGQAVSIYGTSGPTSAIYAVQIDGGSASTYNATKQASGPQMLLYYADNLGAGTHNLTITHQSSTGNLSLFINYAQVDKSGTASSTPSQVNNASHSSGVGSGAIAGIIIGTLAIIGILAGVFLWQRRNRQLSENQIPQESNITPYVAPQSSLPSSTIEMVSYHAINRATNEARNPAGGSRYLLRKGAPAQSPPTANETDVLQDPRHVSAEDHLPPPPDYEHAIESS